MADIVARLKIDDKDYNAKLEKAKKSTRKFSQEGATGVADIASKFTKLAGAVAASKAAIEIFNAAIKSSQTIGDAYARTMTVAKTATNDFVYAIANADFSRFTDGLKGIKQRASEAYDALDQLGNTEISYRYFNAAEREAFAEGITTAKNTSLSTAERRAGLAASKVALENLTKLTDVLSMNTEDYLRKEIGRLAGLNASNVEADALAKALAVDVSRNAAELRASIDSKYSQYLGELAAAENRYNTRGTTIGGVRYKNQNFDPKKYEEVVASIKAKYADIITSQTLLVRISDEELEGLSQKKISVNDASRAMQRLVRQYQEAERALNAPINTNTVGDVLTGYSKNDLGSLAGIPSGASASSLPTTLPSVEPVVLYAESYKALAETSVSAAEGLNAISSAMGSISGVMDEGSAAWMNYASGIISAVSSALPALQSLATAQAAAAATGAALNPWTAIAGVAAVASIGAALANLPKFAQGGVVGGNSYFGDKMLIRVNSGERVLTREQNAAYERGTALNGKVEFVIRDSVLYGILNRGNAYNSRSYHGS